MKQTIMFTHSDLDGVGCGILHKAAFGEDAETHYLTYYNADEVIVNRIKEIEKNGSYHPTVIISDLGIKPETAAVVERYRGQKVLLDHHKTNLWLQEKYSWATIDVDASGTLLVYRYLEDKISSEYLDFALHVDDYDRWIHALPKSKQLNRLLVILRIERFEKRMLMNPKVEFNATEQLLLEIEQERIQDAADKVEKGITVYMLPDAKRIGIGFADQYQSEIANDLIERLNLDAIALIDVNYKKISFRSKPDFDVSVIAHGLGGGGHKNASGVEFNYRYVEDFHGSKYPLIGVYHDLQNIKFDLFMAFEKVYKKTGNLDRFLERVTD